MHPAKLPTDPIIRYLRFDRAAGGIDVETRTVQMSFASELPVRQYFGMEVLDCSPEAVQLDRLNDGAALVDDHNPAVLIGVVEKAWVDPDRVCRCIVRFSKSPTAEVYFQDVLDGIRPKVSCRYVIHEYTEQTTTSENGTETSIVRATKWEPIHVSLVADPADPTVGVNRSAGVKPDATSQRSAPASLPKTTTVKDRTKMDPTEVNTGLQAEQKRTADLLKLADTYEHFGARTLVADALRSGKTAAQFTQQIMDQITERHSSAKNIEIGLAGKDLKAYSILRGIQASISGDWSKAGLERAASEAVAKRTGFVAKGFFVPVESFSRGFSVGTAAEAGNLVGTQLLGSEFIDVLRNALVLNDLGVRVLGGLTSNVAIPRKTAGSTVASYAEIATITASNPSTTQITLAPKRIGAQVLYSHQSIVQGNPDVAMMLQDDLAMGIAAQIEYLAINGTAANNQPRGLVNFNGIGSVVGGTDGLLITWAHLVALESACANANSEPNLRAGYLINSKTRGAAKVVQKAANLPFLWESGDYPLNSYRAAVTNAMISTGSKGASSGILSTLAYSSDWRDLVLALFGGLDIVSDPYTQAGTGQVVLTANQLIDVGCRQPASFSVMSDAKTS